MSSVLLCFPVYFIKPQNISDIIHETSFKLRHKTFKLHDHKRQKNHNNANLDRLHFSSSQSGEIWQKSVPKVPLHRNLTVVRMHHGSCVVCNAMLEPLCWDHRFQSPYTALTSLNAFQQLQYQIPLFPWYLDPFKLLHMHRVNSELVRVYFIMHVCAHSFIGFIQDRCWPEGLCVSVYVWVILG